MRFLLGSSFFFGASTFKREVFELWCENMEHVAKRASRTVMIYEGGSTPPFFPTWAESVRLNGDLGHIHQHLDNGPKSHHAFTGWSASVMALAMLAYLDESDFVYVESDCFPFGPWVDRMYADCGDKAWVFGPKMTSAPWMACAQSLFMVRHKAIPDFVRMFLSNGPENSRHLIGETRFVKMAEFRYPSEFHPVLPAAYLSFGVDRMRPIPWDEPVMYFQQPTPAELAEAKRRNLL